MLRFGNFMKMQKQHHDGLSVNETAKWLEMDNKIVRKYLQEAPAEYQRKPKSWKIDPFRALLRECWERVRERQPLVSEARERGFCGGMT